MGNGFTEETTAATVEHYTPDCIFVALGETYDLDPCHPMNPPPGLPIRKYIKYYLNKQMDGLKTPWPPGAFIFMNPPYNDDEKACTAGCTKKRCIKRGAHTLVDEPGIGQWMAKLAAHGNGIALVFARTDTKLFHETVTTADAVCFIKGRIRFIDQNGVEQDPAKAPSMLVAWGPRAVAALRRSGLGAVVSFKESA